MNDKLEYSFDDEVASKFCYDIEGRKIEVYFTGYLDLIKKKRIESPCVFIIENWSDAKSKIDGGIKIEELGKHIGIFSMVLFLKVKNKDLEIYVNTVDNRYMTLFFTAPKISLKKF